MIVIKEKQSFYKKLFFYKSYFFRFNQFTSNLEDQELQDIITALNIKNRKKRIDFIYDKACDLIDANTCSNCCGFYENQCYVQRKINNNKYNGCCRMCYFQSENGCPTKNLACKLFQCSEVRKRHKVIEAKDIKILKLLSLRQRFLVKSDYFSTREEVLKDLYSFSFSYATIKMTCRLIKRDYQMWRGVYEKR